MTKKAKKLSNNLIMIVLLAVLVVVIVLIHGSSNKSSRTAQSVEIHLTDAGFMPASALINKGTKVTWINDTASVKQVVADPFKADDSISNLKSQPLVENDSYSYTFQTSGTFGYHNELNLSQHAQITVQ